MIIVCVFISRWFLHSPGRIPCYNKTDGSESLRTQSKKGSKFSDGSISLRQEHWSAVHYPSITKLDSIVQEVDRHPVTCRRNDSWMCVSFNCFLMKFLIVLRSIQFSPKVTEMGGVCIVHLCSCSETILPCSRALSYLWKKPMWVTTDNSVTLPFPSFLFASLVLIMLCYKENREFDDVLFQCRHAIKHSWKYSLFLLGNFFSEFCNLTGTHGV